MRLQVDIVAQLGKYLAILAICWGGMLTEGKAQKGLHSDKFEQLDEVFRTPSLQRSASGAPGISYWQNGTDYRMKLKLDTESHRLSGQAEIRYHNHSPDPLSYLWLRLIPFARENAEISSIQPVMDAKSLSLLTTEASQPLQIDTLKGSDGNPLSYIDSEGHLVIDLSTPILPDEDFSFSVSWTVDLPLLSSDTQMGYMPTDDGREAYILSHFFPKICVYSDIEGWQNQVPQGVGDFTHPFGNYQVELELPGQFTVASTGVLQRKAETLPASQFVRYKRAQSSDEPVFIIPPEEAVGGDIPEEPKRKSWYFRADSVRDFAFVCASNFIWEAQRVQLENKEVLLEAFYPPEGSEFWGTYSLELMSHTLKQYADYAFSYPYPKAAVVNIGSENKGSYPMMGISGKAPEVKGDYIDMPLYQAMDDVIQIVGGNYFPHIVNSNGSKWAWMDQGMNTFISSLVAKAYDKDFPIQAEVSYVIPYMKTYQSSMSPIMTNIAQVQFPHYNAAIKPAVAFNILRSVIMGEELFDRALKVYASRWRFKHPSPEDFFRTMEDASGIDLDWFWRGWFYEVEPVDIEVNSLRYFRLDPDSLDTEEDRSRFRFKYSEPEEATGNSMPIPTFTTTDEKLQEEFQDKHFYEISFRNVGGTVMPLVLEFAFKDGTKELRIVPAEIWRKNDRVLRKVFVTDKQVDRIALDPQGLTGDIESANNVWSWENPNPITQTNTVK